MKLIPEWGAKAPLSYDLWKKRNEAIKHLLEPYNRCCLALHLDES